MNGFGGGRSRLLKGRQQVSDLFRQALIFFGVLQGRYFSPLGQNLFRRWNLPAVSDNRAGAG